MSNSVDPGRAPECFEFDSSDKSSTVVTLREGFRLETLVDVGGTPELARVGAGIIESGSNSNGSWIKYGDGTMIQRADFANRTFGPTTVYGNGTYVVASWNFPTSFIDTDFGVSAVLRVSERIILTGMNYDVSSASAVQFFLYDPLNVTSYTMVTVREKWMAIGRWKA